MGRTIIAKKGHKGGSNEDEEGTSFKEGLGVVNASAVNGDSDFKVSSMDSKKIKNREELQDDSIESSAGHSKAVMEGDVNRVIHEKKDRTKKKKKLELSKDEKKSQKAGKKHKKAKDGDDVGEKEEALNGNSEDGVENMITGNDNQKGLEDNSELEAKQDRKKRDKKNKNKDDIDAIETSEPNGDSVGNEGSRNVIDVDDKTKDKKEKKKKKKKSKSGGDGSEGKAHREVAMTKKSVKITDESENPMPRERSRKVSFANHVEFFPSSGDRIEANKNGEDDLVHGKRFSEEEDRILKKAVSNYIELHGLGEDGLDMILNCQSHPEVRNCWKEIGAALPWRPSSSIYYRAHILFERDEKRKWSAEEYEMIRNYVEKRGTKWKTLAKALGKHRLHVKDTWRRIKLANRKRGQWSQEEYQILFDLVNMDLCMKATEERKSKHGMLRDNICWEAISDKLSTRAFSACCSKWYYQLASPMVAEGKWADADDYRLLDALSSLDACCMEDVDWDNLLEHRSGDTCRKRWSQMVQHIGHHGSQSFPEQVEILATRYRPDVLEARETFDNKPYADQP